MKLKMTLWSLSSIAILLVIPGGYNNLLAQGGQIQIGGPDGIVIGGGSGVQIGGANGVQFGAGRGARFGPAGQGLQCGRGRGLRIGSFLLGGSQPPTQPMAYSQDATNRRTPYENRVLVLPASAATPLDYRLNGTPYRLKPGREIQLAGNQRWTVTFSPGAGLSQKSVPLDQPGRYVFRQSDQAWELVREQTLAPPESLPQSELPTAAPITVDKAKVRLPMTRPSATPPPAVAEPSQSSSGHGEKKPPAASNNGRLQSVLELFKTGKSK